MSTSRTMLFIARDRRLEDGRMLRGERLSRPLHRITVLKRVLKRARRRNPAAYALEVTAL